MNPFQILSIALFSLIPFTSLSYFDCTYKDYFLCIEGHVDSLKLNGTPKTFTKSVLTLYHKKEKTVQYLLEEENPTMMRILGDVLYVLCATKGLLFKVSLNKDIEITAKINLSAHGPFTPTDLTAIEGKLYIYSESHHTVLVFDTKSQTLYHTFTWGPIETIHGFQGHAYLYHPAQNHLKIMNLATQSEVAPFPIDSLAHHQQIHFHGQTAFLCNQHPESPTEIALLDLPSRQIVGHLQTQNKGEIHLREKSLWCGQEELCMLYPSNEVFERLNEKDYVDYFFPTLSPLNTSASTSFQDLSQRQSMPIAIYLERNEDAFLQMGDDYQYQHLERFTPVERLYFADQIKDKTFLNGQVWASILRKTHQQILQRVWQNKTDFITPLMTRLEQVNPQDILVVAYKRACRLIKIRPILEDDTYYHFLGGQYIDWGNLKRVISQETEDGEQWCHTHGPLDVLPLMICLKGEVPDAQKITQINELMRLGILHKHPFLTSLAYLAFEDGLWGAEKDERHASMLKTYANKTQEAYFNENVLAYRTAMGR